MCLWCGDKSKVYLETKAVQQHMVDKGHCKLLHEGDAFLEYAEFFDYRYLSSFHALHEAYENSCCLLIRTDGANHCYVKMKFMWNSVMR